MEGVIKVIIHLPFTRKCAFAFGYLLNLLSTLTYLSPITIIIDIYLFIFLDSTLPFGYYIQYTLHEDMVPQGSRPMVFLQLVVGCDSPIKVPLGY